MTQVMADKERFVRRIQLRRSVYHILGEEGEKLHNLNKDIFHDDDFFHQVGKGESCSKALD